MRFFIMLCMLSLLLSAQGCARKTRHVPANVPQTPVNTHATQTRQIPAIPAIAVEGRIDVRLRTGFSKPSIILQGDSRDLAAVVTQVQNGVMHVTLQSGYPRFGPVRAEIRAGTLRAFSYAGIGTVTGDSIQSTMLDVKIANPGRTVLKGNIRLRRLEVSDGGYLSMDGVSSQDLHVIMEGKPRVQLYGVIGLSRLNVEGEGSFALYWVQSRDLVVHERGSAFVQLAGIVDKMEVELYDRSEFAGRFLRAKRTYVRTHDFAVARISSVRHQHTLAMDRSNIYYYNIPGTRADFMADDGSVLDMREWSMFTDRNWDIYNR